MRLEQCLAAVKYDLRGEDGTLSLRRFTGHPSTGWWLWGSDAPRTSELTSQQQAELATLTRAVMGVGGAVGGADGKIKASLWHKALLSKSLRYFILCAKGGKGCFFSVDKVPVWW